MTVDRPSLAQLEQTDDFIHRHIGPGGIEIVDMLNTLSIDTLDDLIDKAVPAAIRADVAAIHPAATETHVLGRLKAFAEKNKVFRSMIGLGYHDCITPAVILRNVFENPGWYTAYTPYQPEISQGRLEALLAFQQMVIDLTGLDIANASLLDEGTAAAEAMTLMKRVAKAKGHTLLVDTSCHPQTIAVVETRARPLGLTVRVEAVADGVSLDGVFGVLIQYPATDGALFDPAGLADRVHAAGALLTVAADPLALVMLTPPGEWGADVVVGTAQRFGVPLGFGGPHAAFMATRDAYMRSLPGRLVGVSIDRAGRPAMRLALQTREQHIRRDKATSNICTAQVLLAVMAAFYAIYHGPDGLRTIANRVHRLTAILADGLKLLGANVIHDAFFDTLTIAAGGEAQAILGRAQTAGINLRDYGDGRVGIALDETTGRSDIEGLWTIVSGRSDHGLKPTALDHDVGSAIPERLQRQSAVLTHPVFNSHHSETRMLRYLHGLETKDIALNQSMIPLGSCTMKLNATTEMIPVTWPEFARIHPFAPDEQTIGYREMIGDLAHRLTELTGFAAVSLQPNAGSQGEYSGLLVIRKYHDDRGESARTICLIPSSAHGTNPASAIMANFKVVVVECDRHGNIDLDDLKSKTQQYRETLGALMVTYPSTHGVFESQIREICTLVHDAGGQVYMDGANFNAMVGICLPGAFGPDVAHLNLHKTFCIPHGGGGPGIGPIGVAAHLAPYLPNHPLVAEAGPATGVGPIAAAPWGSAGILPITWAYIALMGDAGLRRASAVAILNANYIAKRLDDYFPVLYKGESGLVAHECIIDVRGLKESAEVTVEDIAKRLMDFGFHAPTMSWPVAGTLMIEPTESESKEELDRFCEAMIAIRGEAARIEKGDWPADDNPLHNAPHTADMLTAEDWRHPYSRAEAAYPVATLRRHKYWPPVGRIDNVYGDRHIVCTCPAVDSYRDAAE
jgi:glycine dehydrogenase